MRRSLAAVVGLLALSGCGYRLAHTNRTIHVALSSEGPVHPDAIPSVQSALAERIRSEGMRVGSGEGVVEIDVVIVGSEEAPSAPTGSMESGFESSAWEVEIRARATLRRADGSTTDLGAFDASATERVGASAPEDDEAQASGYATAARSLAERIIAALISAP